MQEERQNRERQMKAEIFLTQMNKNESGKIVKIEGGQEIKAKIENIGIRKGTRIKLKSQQLLKGPVVISFGNTQVGIGYGMARKITVEVDR